MQKITSFLISLFASALSVFNPSEQLISPLPQTGIEISTPTSTVLTSPTPTIKIVKTSKKLFYRIVFLGDSMTDFLGEDFEFVQTALLTKFPKTRFEILNYGVGATDLASGSARLTQSVTRHDKTLQPIFSINSDIIVLESFAYNQGSTTPSEIAKYKLTLNEIISKVREKNIELILARTIAPNSKVITDGIPGFNFSEKEKKEKAETVSKYFEIFKTIATQSRLPLADAYVLSLDNTLEGKLIYINEKDHLHPSEEGLKLYSQTVVKQIEKLIVLP